MKPVRASARGQPLRHPRSVRRAAPRADQGNRQLVPGLDRSFDVQQDGRIGDVFKRTRGIPCRPVRRAARPAGGREPVPLGGIETPMRAWPIFWASLGPTPLTAESSAWLACRARPAEPNLVQQRPAGLRANARHGRQLDQVDQPHFGVFGLLRFFGQASLPVSAEQRRSGIRLRRLCWSKSPEDGPHVVFGRRVGELHVPDRARQDEADLARADSSCRGSWRL